MQDYQPQKANLTHYLFFTGKGGVGKTTTASATAINLADAGNQVMLVSTDPASNLQDVFNTALTNKPQAIKGVPGLFAANFDPVTAAGEYRESVVGPYRGVLPAAAIKNIEEQLSGSCTVEIAAFNEFANFLTDPTVDQRFDYIIFDTAPTGHTLRLLTLPSAWSGFMDDNTSGTSCLGPLAGLQAQQAMYKQTVKALGDAQTTTLVLVTRPEPSAFREAQRTSRELRTLGVNNQDLIVNGVFESQTPSDAISVAMQRRGDDAVASMPEELGRLPRTTIPLASAGLMGVDSLRQVGLPSNEASDLPLDMIDVGSCPEGLGSLIDELSAVGHGVILAMGKGGVGKTTVAAAVAVALAERGFDVHLSTTDPAAHIAATIAADEIAGLTVGRIDPAKETADYTAEVLQNAGKDLDAEGRALLEEDLRSPCTEEIAVFRAFAKAVSGGSDRFVVLDTAPTGHTLLLLDATGAYHRDVVRQMGQSGTHFTTPMMQLQDPRQTKVILVTLAETTPVLEAANLQSDLRRAGIEPWAWIVNNSVAAALPGSALLRQRARNEFREIKAVATQHARRYAVVPLMKDEPIGVQRLLELSGQPITQK